MQIPTLIAVLGLAALAGAVGEPARSRVVPCGEIIDRTAFPFRGSPGHRYRQVLATVSVPPRTLAQLGRVPNRSWPYWLKAGLVIRANGTPVSVTVPQAWRTRAAIAWGNGDGAFSSVRFEGCGGGANVGNAYAGGFVLRVRSACLPLVFRARSRTAVVRFGLGRVCP